jgi:hypothetical protein
MLFREKFLHGFQDGTVTVAFRRWRRPSVKSGGTLLTPVGQLHIESVARVATQTISAADARRAGYDSREALLDELTRTTEGDVYRVEFGELRADPRIALRESVPDSDGVEALAARLRRLDSHAGGKPWTLRVLETIHAHPAVRAGDLCVLVGQEKMTFKLNVRKLKALGLTESLEVGYRLSPRGESVLRSLRDRK